MSRIIDTTLLNKPWINQVISTLI